MNIYVFNGNKEAGEPGMAVVYAHSADEARRLLRDRFEGRAPDVKLARSIFLDRNPKAQVLGTYFE